MKTTKEIILDYEQNGASMKQKWYSEEEVEELINKMIEDVELAGYDNPIDEAYHKALIDFKIALFGAKQ